MRVTNAVERVLETNSGDSIAWWELWFVASVEPGIALPKESAMKRGVAVKTGLAAGFALLLTANTAVAAPNSDLADRANAGWFAATAQLISAQPHAVVETAGGSALIVSGFPQARPTACSASRSTPIPVSWRHSPTNCRPTTCRGLFGCAVTCRPTPSRPNQGYTVLAASAALRDSFVHGANLAVAPGDPTVQPVLDALHFRAVDTWTTFS